MSNQLQENLNLILEEKNTKLLPENLKAGITCLGVTGTLVADGDSGADQIPTCIQTEDGQLQNVAILSQGYRTIILDDVLDDEYEGDDIGVTGKITGCIIDDTDFKLTIDFIKEGWLIGASDPIMVIKFYNDEGQEIPELCMYDVVVEGLGTLLAGTSKAISTITLASPLDWQRAIQSATSYELYFTSF